uniref:Putative secreted protein n=1 Tax=Ixodes scapularis TaxID=6945 RepID=Q8MVB8_IXOSC|nr:putative secreted protein [Ixodes scapularis]
MIALVCVVATALACCGSHVEAGLTGQTYSLLSRQDEPVDMAKPKNNSAKLWLKRKKFYLVYRSAKNDTEFGGEAQCVQMKAFDIELPKKRFSWNTPVTKLKVFSSVGYRNNQTGHMDGFTALIITKKSYEGLVYDDMFSIGELTYTHYIYKDYELLFTDYETCFTIWRPSDDVYMVWMIDRRNITDINPQCETAYHGPVNEYGCTVVKPKYYVYDEMICS